MGFKMPSDMSEDDVHQWISDGYVIYDGQPCKFYGDIQYEGGEEVCSFCVVTLDGSGDVIRITTDEAECFWPIGGAINRTVNGMGVAVHVARLGRRQWRRTFNFRCVEVTVPNSWTISKRIGGSRFLGRATAMSDSFVQELFEPTYPTVREALSSIRSRDAASVAVSPQLTIVGDAKGSYLVYYRTSVVGGLDEMGAFTPSVKGYMTDAASYMLREGMNDAG